MNYQTDSTRLRPKNQIDICEFLAKTAYEGKEN